MAFKNALAEMQGLDMADEMKRIGESPILLRIIMAVLLMAVVGVAGYIYIVKPHQQKLVSVERKEIELRNKFDSEQAKAANLAAYAEQLEEMKKTFNVMLRQLPNKTDIESLLVDLSQTSVASGLDVEYFKPEVEIPREFYAEYPIRISVTGQYHQFGQFISGLAALPRIVTLAKIDIAQLKQVKGQQANDAEDPINSRGKLKMDLTATTYRYLEDE